MILKIMKKILIELNLIIFIITTSNILFAQKFIKFDPIPTKSVIKKSPSSIYESKKEINIILRNSSYSFTSENQDEGINTYSKRLLFNTIEKEFIKFGLNVKDASLYELDKGSTNNNVDLLVDLAAREPVVYNTNILVKKNEDKKSKELEKLILWGSRYDFRLTDPRNNEVLGYYTFNFVPCTQGCEIDIHRSRVNKVEFVEKKYPKNKDMYEASLDRDYEYSEFCKNVASYLINELKKNTEVKSIINESEDLFIKAKKNVFQYFPVSYFEDNFVKGKIKKEESIYIYNYTYNKKGENINEFVKDIFIKRGYKVTENVGEAKYFLFNFKGILEKRGSDKESMQFQFIDAHTLEKLSGASFRIRRGDYDEDIIHFFIDSL
jgi:hypothetical protein